MRIDLKANGSVRNTFEGGSPGDADWYPDDTRFEQRGGSGPVWIAHEQPAGWAARAARAWNDVARAWEPTGGEPQESGLERAIRMLRENPVPELPESPTAADVVAQVRVHQRYVEGYRQVLLRMLTFIGRRLYG